jgi:hypothetical protein
LGFVLWESSTKAVVTSDAYSEKSLQAIKRLDQIRILQTGNISTQRLQSQDYPLTRFRFGRIVASAGNIVTLKSTSGPITPRSGS